MTSRGYYRGYYLAGTWCWPVPPGAMAATQLQLRPHASRQEHAVLKRWSEDPTDEYRATQAKVLLRAAERKDLTNKELAVEFALDEHTVSRLRHRFAKGQKGEAARRVNISA